MRIPLSDKIGKGEERLLCMPQNQKPSAGGIHFSLTAKCLALSAEGLCQEADLIQYSSQGRELPLTPAQRLAMSHGA